MLRNVLRHLFRRSPRDSVAAEIALSEVRDALRKKDYTAATSGLQRVLLADPYEVKAYLLRASIAKRQNKFHEAEADYRHALSLRPESGAVRIELAALLHRLNRFEESLSVIDDALWLEPTNPRANMYRGLFLRELGRLSEAERALLVASQLDPGKATIRCHLASVIADQGRLTEATELLSRVLDDDPNHLDAHWALATIELALGRFGSGFDHYEYRIRREDFYGRPRDLPWWQPGTDRPRPLLVLAEQAIGDEIMFASCFEDLLATEVECLIECDPRLGALFSRSFPRARVLATRDPKSTHMPPADGAVAQIAAGSLPRYYRRSADQFPSHQGYLKASPERADYWRERLKSLGPGLKIGLSWIGGAHKTRRALRSMRLTDLYPLLRLPAVHFVSLQYTDCAAEIDAFGSETGIRINHWPDAIADYDETASLVSALDLVVSVTTAIVHLSGALGKAVWVLVPATPEWRYMAAGSSMPWYPSARLFRQSALMQWSPVVEQVRAELSALISSQRVHER